MDVNRLKTGEKIAGVSGILLFVFMFFKWFGASGEVAAFGQAVGVSTSANAWESFDFIDLVLFITVIAAVALAVIAATATQINAPVALSAIVTGLGGLSTLLVFYRIINPPGSADRKIGVFLGLIAA